MRIVHDFFGDADVVIIGSGAAELAAAQTLRDRQLAVLILEARDRVGGRALTRRLDGGIALDVGCEWLHSADRNPFLQIGRSLGFEVMPAQPHWSEQSFDINFPVVDQRQFRLASEAFHDRLERAAASPVDTPAADWLEPGNR
jgi:monoamine oxidase